MSVSPWQKISVTRVLDPFSNCKSVVRLFRMCLAHRTKSVIVKEAKSLISINWNRGVRARMQVGDSGRC